MQKAIDLSQEIYTGMPVFPGHMKTLVWDHVTHAECAKSMDPGYSYTTRGLLMCDHGPTHVDAINHIDPSPDAPSVEKMPLEVFFGTAICLDLSWTEEHSLVTPEQIKEAEKKSGQKIQQGDIVLFHFGHFNKYYPTEKYLDFYSGFTYEAAAYLTEEKKIKNWGADTPSPDRPPTKSYPVHQNYRKTHVPHMENLCNLEKLIGKRFMFYGFPLRIRNGSGSPIRAVAVLEE